MGGVLLALVLPQAGEAHGGAKLKGARLLSPSHIEGTATESFGL